MPSRVNPTPTYNRLLLECRNTIRVLRSILETDNLNHIRSLVLGLITVLEAICPPERPKRKYARKKAATPKR